MEESLSNICSRAIVPPFKGVAMEWGFWEESSAMSTGVMTEEQIEILRRQIAAYASLCEQLVHMYRQRPLSDSHFPGSRFQLYSDHMMAASGHGISGRQRWNPTPMQLQILERVFDRESGSPSKERIKEVTAELSQHGKITEASVCYWFQNRRARSKRKRKQEATSTAGSEAETDVDWQQEISQSMVIHGSI